MGLYMLSINVPLTYKIISLGSKGPVLTLRISNTQEKVRNRTSYTSIIHEGVRNKTIGPSLLDLDVS